MIASDVPLLTERLTVLAATLDAKPPSAAVVEEWFRLLREFPYPAVAGVLLSWPRRKVTMPRPAEVIALLDEMHPKAAAPRVVAPELPLPRQPLSDAGKKALADMHALLANVRATRTQTREKPTTTVPENPDAFE